MVIPELKDLILLAIDSSSNTFTMRQVLVDFKEAGGSQRDALDTLESMRNLRDPMFEDNILDMMDVAYGWCNQRYWIWDEAFNGNGEG